MVRTSTHYSGQEGVLIEAGLYSRVRDLVLETPLNPEETGDLAYRATFKKEQLEHLNDSRVNELCQKTAITSWLGPDKHSIFYPVRGGTEFNLVLLRPDNLEKGTRRVQGDVEEMRESYTGWDKTSVYQSHCTPVWH
jgi:salicylate hydroxylase